MSKIVFSSLIAINEMLTSHCDNLSTYIPFLFWHTISSRPDHATIFLRCCHVFEEKGKAIELLLSKESGKKKKGNRFDKDWVDKHAASNKGSYGKQHKFKEGQDLEEAAIDGFLKPKIRLPSSGNDNKVNKSEEFVGKHYFVGSFCFTGVSGSCAIPSLARSVFACYSWWYLPRLPFSPFRFFRHF